MTSASDHLLPHQIDSFVDHELQPDETQIVNEHIATCHVCALRVLTAFETKRATAVAAAVTPSPGSLQRLTAHLHASIDTAQLPQKISSSPQAIRQSSPRPRFANLPLWSGIAACLALMIGLIAWQSRRNSATITAELLDQHLATLSASATPQVLSSDRHTVKPWFQGKLPFSFNLPEPAELPPDTTLQGADFAYLNGNPAALLLFTIHQHHVSVFLTERNRSTPPVSTRSGFSLRTATTAHLQLTAVSDVNPQELEALLNTLTKAQQTD